MKRTYQDFIKKIEKENKKWEEDINACKTQRKVLKKNSIRKHINDILEDENLPDRSVKKYMKETDLLYTPVNELRPSTIDDICKDLIRTYKKLKSMRNPLKGDMDISNYKTEGDFEEEMQIYKEQTTVELKELEMQKVFHLKEIQKRKKSHKKVSVLKAALDIISRRIKDLKEERKIWGLT